MFWNKKKERKTYNLSTVKGIEEFTNNTEGSIESTSLILVSQILTVLMEVKELLKRQP